MARKLTIQDLWEEAGFEPNPEQKRAILHLDGPLFLAAGPGSGKTRVLLWRTLYLIVFHNVPPEEIFLATFTEKAAHQLREGIRALLGLVTNLTGSAYDISGLYVGTAHSLCRRLIIDRRFSADAQRNHAPILLDELAQYFYLRRPRTWTQLGASAGFEIDSINQEINSLFEPGRQSVSRHRAVVNAMAFFNRLSEEGVIVDDVIGRIQDQTEQRMLKMYSEYKASLRPENAPPKTDFALLQQAALDTLKSSPDSGTVFRYIIIDEYQDTNTIQERLYFKLAEAQRNICVVGDDDQALYRFRGATVENFVEFPDRCLIYLKLKADPVKRVTLSTNYRSLEEIVSFYEEFIEQCDWQRDDDTEKQYRVHDKAIRANRQAAIPAVVASTPGHPDDACREIAGLIRQLIDDGKVEDPNQIAFLYPSLKSTQVPRMRSALESVGLEVYAPRAGRFLEVPEAVDMLSIYALIFGRPAREDYPGSDYSNFHNWLDEIEQRGRELTRHDVNLNKFVRDRKREIRRAVEDFGVLTEIVERSGWDLAQPYDIDTMKRALNDASGLSRRARRSIDSARFERAARHRAELGQFYDLRYILLRATSLDWTVIELFHQLCGFEQFKKMLDLAERGRDEGPICNLGLLSQYLSRFMDEYVQVISAGLLKDEQFQRIFFVGYLYALFRLGESEYEDSEDPFPRGRIPFLTIHQAKGLEFPVVVLGNPRKQNRGPQRVEALVRPLLDREGEPLDRLAEFDTMRLFYVALSRAQNLLVVPHWRSQGNYINSPFREMLGDSFARIPGFDVKRVPSAKLKDKELPRNFSFTGDYLPYLRCPRQYMIFHKYRLAPSTTQTYAFGRLVHQTLEDLHHFLIAERGIGRFMKLTDHEVEEYIREVFELNFERIQEETGAGLAPDIRAIALLQVIFYWRKLRQIATTVTETEVRLNLPRQFSPQGREFGIEGVVDIVQEDDQTTMFDIKTHDIDYVQAHQDDYAQQLNIYAYIWQILRDQPLHRTAVITTSFPESLRLAIFDEDEIRIAQELSHWEPVVEIPFDSTAVENAVRGFGEVVDHIELGQFAPPRVSRLRERSIDGRQTFATRICRNCDARFSCRAYRQYAKTASGRADFEFKAYFQDELEDWELEERMAARLEATPQSELIAEMVE